MKKFFLFALLFAATAMLAEVKVETFDTKDGSASTTYVTSVTTKECQQTKWTFFSGGILKNLGDMGSSNFAAVIRAKKSTETVYPYIMSDSIEGGVDSLWFTWNSNGNETGGTWNVKIYINDTQVGAITGEGGPKAAAPFNSFKLGSLGVTGKFVFKFVNESPYNGTGNSMRFVFDDLSWEPKKAAGEKDKPEFAFAEESLIKKVDVIAFTNTLTNGSDATPMFESSNTEVATVGETGTVTIVGVGTTTITASVAETETYKAATASYTLRVVPLNFHLETFDGAVNATGNATYHAKDSITPMSNAGIVWTVLLGSVRDNLGQSGTSNVSAVIRGKKSAEENYAFLASDAISGGIDSLAFDWNANGTEASRENPWNIEIYINDVKVGTIADKCTAVQQMGSWYRYTLGNLKIAGDFTLKFINKNEADDGTSNHYRWVVDNIEWYSYEKPCEGEYGIMVDGETYIAGEAQTSLEGKPEYKIVAELEKDQTVVFYDNCSKASFLATQKEGCYWFNVGEGVFVAPAAGKYTMYLELYGYEDNRLWTEYEATGTGIENAGEKIEIRKAIENGVVIIYRNGVRYNIQGQAL